MPFELLSNLVITKIHSVHRIYSEAGKKAHRVNRSSSALILKYEGETVYTSGGMCYRSDLLHPIYLPKGSDYEWHCITAGHFISIEFECSAKDTVPISFSAKDGERILAFFEELERTRARKAPLYELKSIRDLYNTFLYLGENDVKRYIPNEKQKKLLPAVNYIAEHSDESLTNDALAAKAGLSTVYFRKLFHEVYGTSPIAYARSIRIKKAKAMLRGDYGSISEVAQSLGYPSIYDFSRDFKKHVGISPLQYAKMHA